MTETRLQAVKRRWRNITNAIRGVNIYVDEHGTRYVDFPLTADEAAIAASVLRYYATIADHWNDEGPEIRGLAARFEAVS